MTKICQFHDWIWEGWVALALFFHLNLVLNVFITGGLIGLCCVTYLHSLVLDFKQVFCSKAPSRCDCQREFKRSVPWRFPRTPSLYLRSRQKQPPRVCLCQSRGKPQRELFQYQARRRGPSKALSFRQRRTAVRATQLGSRARCRPQRPGAGRPKLRPFSVQHIYIETQP